MSNYNLIIFHTPTAEHISDFLTIRNMMAGRAPDIDVHIISRDTTIPPDFWTRAAELPTLIFSPLPIKLDPSIRGARMMSKYLPKLEELELFAKAGFPVPRTKKIMPETVLDESEWGPFVVVKPNEGRGGRDIRLRRTKDVRYFNPMYWPKRDPRHGIDMLAQQYVNTGPYSRSYRVFTVLGRIIYAITTTATQALPSPDPLSQEDTDINVTANGVERILELSSDQEVISLAESIHRSFPHIPTMGIDIIREHGTGKLFVLEMNSRGVTWHLSSDHGLFYQRKDGLNLYGQFNGLKVIAEALTDFTRRLAV